MSKRRTILDAATRRKIAYGLYSRRSLIRFEYEAQLEVLRQQGERAAASDGAMQARVRRVLERDQEYQLDLAMALVEPKLRGM